MAKSINRTPVPPIGSLLPLLICLLILITIIWGCAAQVEIEKKQKPIDIKIPGLITSRGFLLHKKIEGLGYGLYSYVLLSRKAQNQKEFNRYLCLFDAFRTGLNPTSDYLERGIKKEDINVTYWPILAEEGGRISWEIGNSNWTFFINNYDYPRSRIILNRVRGLNKPGPFIVSYNAPLGVPKDRLQVWREEVLIFDLSNIHEDLFDDVLLHFQEKVAEGPETWKQNFDIEEIRLRFRSVLKDQADDIIYLAIFLKDFIG
jgi:hypothetical protein